MNNNHELLLIRELCAELDEKGIKYCHWKSNAAVDRSASGDNDIDILISRPDVQHFREILIRLGFKECVSHKVKQLPGVENFFGYDFTANKFIHVHAHYQLVIGHDMTKNYHLPIEKWYIDSAEKQGLFMVPAPEFELVIFVIRMIIKHSTWDVILREGSLSKTARQELIYLESRADRQKLEYILEQYLPFIDVALFDECQNALQPGCSLLKRIKAGQHLLRRMKVYARRPLLEDFLLKHWRTISLIFQYRFLRRYIRYRLVNGGAMVAIIGGDGTGKTTAIDQLYKWLSPIMDTRRIHMGKPRWSFTTILIRSVLKIGTILHLSRFETVPVTYVENGSSRQFPGFSWLIRQVCSARDRLLTYKTARRFASNGGILISDRFPIRQIKRADSPNASIQMTNEKKDHWLVKRLINLELKYYHQMLPPELLIVLKLDPMIALQRKQEEGVLERSKEFWECDWEDTTAHVVDASQSKEEVLSQVMRLVWSKL